MVYLSSDTGPQVARRAWAIRTEARGTRSRLPEISWSVSAALVAASVSLLVLVMVGWGERGTDIALMLTGRWAFLLFWFAYSGAGLFELFGDRFSFLRRKARRSGLAFVAAISVHMGLVGRLCAIGAAPSARTFVFFGLGLACTCVLALFSMIDLHRWLDRRLSRLIRAVALNYIACIFAVDFLSKPFDLRLWHVMLYMPFAFLSLVGPLIWISAQVLPLRQVLVRNRSVLP